MEINNKDMLRIVTDRRLKAIDVKVLMYFASTQDTSPNQEALSDKLDVSRENLNRSIQKLKALNYIDVAKSNSHKYNYQDYIHEYYLDANGNEVEVRKKVKSNNTSYFVDFNIVKFIKFEDILELCNIDVKNANLKLKLEDKYVLHESSDEISEDVKITCSIKELSDFNDFLKLYKLYYKRYGYMEHDDIQKMKSNDYISIADALLFLSSTDNFRNEFSNTRILDIISNFREKYMEQFISYYMQNTDLLDEDFFIQYNTINKNILSNKKIYNNHIMKMCGYTNRETSRMIAKHKRVLELNNIEYKDTYTFKESISILKTLLKFLEVDNFKKDATFNLDLETLESIYKD